MISDSHPESLKPIYELLKTLYDRPEWLDRNIESLIRIPVDDPKIMYENIKIETSRQYQLMIGEFQLKMEKELWKLQVKHVITKTQISADSP